ncbi:MAG: Carbon monoxide oxidation accessory protein CoxD, partial [uncultured Solirubrobacteraceae bacterium]
AQRADQPALSHGRGARDGRVPGAAAAQAAARRRRAGGWKDGTCQGARGGDRHAADPAAVLRGHRRPPGALRLGLPPSAPAAARRHVDAAVLRGVPAAPAAAGGDHAARLGAPDRRARPRGRRVRGVPARVPVGLPGHDPGGRRHQGHRAADRDHHVQPHARSARGAQAPLPVSLDRPSGPSARGRDRARAPAARRPVPRRPGVRLRPGPALAGPLPLAGSRRNARLGPGIPHARPQRARLADGEQHAGHAAEGARRPRAHPRRRSRRGDRAFLAAGGAAAPGQLPM